MKRLLLLLFGITLIFCVALALYYLRVYKSNQQPSSSQIPTTKLEVVSDTKGFSVKLSNKDFLLKKLNENNFYSWMRVRNYLNAKTITVQGLTIHLTDGSIKDTQKFLSMGAKLPDKSNGEVQAFGMNYNSNNQHLDLYIFENPQYVKISTNEQIGMYFSRQIISAVYILTHPPTKETVADDRPFGDDLGYANRTVNSLPQKTFLIIQK